MALVTVLTADRMLGIEAGSVVSGLVNVDGDLILTRHDGSTVDAGHVRGSNGADATALLGVVDTNTVDLTLSGAGTPASPWSLKADLKLPTSKLMQLAPGYVGPGAAKVTDVGWGLGTQYGPYEWQGSYDPVGNPVVRLETGIDGTPVITGHAQGNTVGGWRVFPLLPASLYPYTSAGVSPWEPLEGRFAAGVRTCTGIVNLRGLYYTNATIASGTTLFTLPPDMWPDSIMLIQANQSDTVSGIYVYPTGEVKNAYSIASGQYISLSNVMYPAAGVATWTPMGTMLNGWVDYGDSTYGIPRYWVDPYGVCWFAGLIKNGTTTNGTPVWNIPAALQVTGNAQQHTSTLSSGGTMGGFRFSAVNATGGTPSSMDFLVGSNIWSSLCGVTWVTTAGLSLPWTSFDTYLNTWGNYSTVVNANQYGGVVRRPDGLVFLHGLIASGVIGNAIAMLPSRYLPKARNLFQVISNAARGRLDVTGLYSDAQNRQIVASQGSNTWFSLDSIKWYAGGV